MGMIAQELARGTVTATAIGSADAAYANPTTKDTIITRITLYNMHTGSVLVTIGHVPDSAGTVDTMDSADIIYNVTLETTETFDIDCKVVLRDTNETIKIFAGTTAVICYHLYGVTLADQS